jgi:hypothetical protein
MVLGAGGKMGPSLAVLARRAAAQAGHPLEVIASSRFSDAQTRSWLERQGVRTIPCDLLNRHETARLPDSDNVIYLVGLKFGTADKPCLTWAMNTLVPAHVGERYSRARLAVLSTGNVYGLSPVTNGGSVETDVLAPLGEYPNAAIARERIFEFFSLQNTTPLAVLRLNYAVELRYGVMVDIAQKVFRGEPVDVTMGHFNCIWQGDANEFIIRAVAEAKAPPWTVNLTGTRILSVRQTALDFGKLFGRAVQFTGGEASTALVSNAGRAQALWGEPPTALTAVMDWTADWIQRGGRVLNKPTHFEVRDGRY